MYNSPPPPPAASPYATAGQQQERTVSQSSYGGSSTSYEPYGAISQRRSYTSTSYPAASPVYNYAADDDKKSGLVNNNNNSQKYNGSNKKQQQHFSNTAIAIAYIPTLYAWNASLTSNLPRASLGIFIFILYLLDLTRSRQGLLACAWTLAFIQCLVTLWTRLLVIDDNAADPTSSGVGVLLVLILAGVEAMQWACGACWLSLQMQWLTSNSNGSKSNNDSTHENDTEPNTASAFAQTLHGLLPIVAATTISYSIIVTGYMQDTFGREVIARVLPLIWASILCFSMWLFHTNNTKSVTTSTAKLQVLLLVLLPGMIHFSVTSSRIASFYSSWDDIHDFILSISVPLMLWQLVVTTTGGSNGSPFAMLGNKKLKLICLAVTCLASFSFQFRYLVPVSQRIAHFYMGTDLQIWLVALYWSCATLCTGLVVNFWDMSSSQNAQQKLLGEYHEDVLQLLLALAGLCIGKAFGLPWSFIPLPILAFIGLSMWLSSRLLRYLALFLFVVHASGIVLFTYRFAGMTTHTMDIPPTLIVGPVSLLRFAQIVSTASVVAGLVAGLSVRSNGGYGARTLKKLDVAGVLTILYSALLTALEFTLLRRALSSQDLTGIEESEHEDKMTYTHLWIFMTSGALMGVAQYMKSMSTISKRSYTIVTALALGKAIAAYIDMMEDNESFDDALPTNELFNRAMIASVMMVVVTAPRYFVKPIHMKTSVRYQRSLASSTNQHFGSLPPGSGRTVMLYVFILLPIMLLIAIPFVLVPLANAVKGESDLDDESVPLTELCGLLLLLWGLSCLSMLNHYLPDGGGELLKKVAALSFLLGIGTFIISPTLTSDVPVVSSNPYIAISTRGSRLVSRTRHRTGGWGLLLASLATLLAITGPLQLKERRLAAGRNDKYLLFRCMVFSVMFGGGVSWFIIMLCMNQSDWMYLAITCIACMSIAFLGTITAVLGYYIDAENFDDVESLFRIFFMAFPVFMPVAGLQQFLSAEDTHPFGSDGWLATYLLICCISSLGMSAALRARKEKSPSSRGITNASCIFAWICAMSILYGRYGISGLDTNFDLSLILGIPSPIVGTVALSFILLMLQGEKADSTRSKLTSQRLRHDSAGIVFTNLGLHNKVFPVLVGTVLVFLVASLYAILLRGSGFPWIAASSKSIAESHQQVLQKVLDKTATIRQKNLVQLVQQATIHNQAMIASAKLVSCSIWTSSSIFAPLIYFVGVASTMPSFILQLMQWWFGSKPSTASVVFAMPLNLIPLILCRGLAPLNALAVMNLLVGGYQLSSLRNKNQV